MGRKGSDQKLFLLWRVVFQEKDGKRVIVKQAGMRLLGKGGEMARRGRRRGRFGAQVTDVSI